MIPSTTNIYILLTVILNIINMILAAKTLGNTVVLPEHFRFENGIKKNKLLKVDVISNLL